MGTKKMEGNQYHQAEKELNRLYLTIELHNLFLYPYTKLVAIF